MSEIKHHALIVTSWNSEHLKHVRSLAKEIISKHFDGRGEAKKLVSKIIHGISNGFDSFFIAPDGSKEGWENSNLMDDFRFEFISEVKKLNVYCDVVEIEFGGDDKECAGILVIK